MVQQQAPTAKAYLSLSMLKMLFKLVQRPFLQPHGLKFPHWTTFEYCELSLVIFSIVGMFPYDFSKPLQFSLGALTGQHLFWNVYILSL